MKVGSRAYGFYALFAKEVVRFLKVTVQTILTPVVTALLYLLVFGQALEAHVEVYEGVSYSAFLIPGLMMMSIIQNAFANSSSSLIQSKMMGNLVFVLLSPISSLEFGPPRKSVSQGYFGVPDIRASRRTEAEPSIGPVFPRCTKIAAPYRIAPLVPWAETVRSSLPPR